MTVAQRQRFNTIWSVAQSHANTLFPKVDATLLALLLLLITGDVFIIALHAAHQLQLANHSIFSLEGDRNAGECFQYVKVFWMTIASALLWRRTAQKILAAWAVIFAYLLADDAMQIHERVGMWLGRVLHLPSMRRFSDDDLGQVLFAGLGNGTAPDFGHPRQESERLRAVRNPLGGRCAYALWLLHCSGRRITCSHG